MEIKDPHGVWLKSAARYPLHDSTSNTTFFPGVLIKATHTDWVKGQSVIEEQPDPQAPQEPKAQLASPVAPVKIKKAL
jgi:hypothetical protein